jgi:hypothetical protein
MQSLPWGLMPKSLIICMHCGAQELFSSTIPRSAACESCQRDLRSCVHCQYFDKRSSNECKESQAELVTDKEKSNFCGYFVPHGKRSEKAPKSSASRQGWDQLFRNKKGTDSSNSSPKPSDIEQEFSKFLTNNKEKL